MATPAALAAWASEARGGYSPKKEVVDALAQLLDAGDVISSFIVTGATSMEGASGVAITKYWEDIATLVGQDLSLSNAGVISLRTYRLTSLRKQRTLFNKISMAKSFFDLARVPCASEHCGRTS